MSLNASCAIISIPRDYVLSPVGTAALTCVKFLFVEVELMEEGYFVCSVHYFKVCLCGRKQNPPWLLLSCRGRVLLFFSVGSLAVLHLQSLCIGLSMSCSFSEHLSGCMSEGMKHSHSGLIAEQRVIFKQGFLSSHKPFCFAGCYDWSRPVWGENEPSP